MPKYFFKSLIPVFLRILKQKKEPKQTPPKGGWETDATADDAYYVKTAVEKRVGKKAFKAMSYGEKDQAMADEFKKRGFVKSGKRWVKKESVRESKGRRCTVKEVKQWMRTLEENRYKKTYNSDCRRVSWMVNHIGENVENMPVSMRKKWSKAAYGR